MNKYVKKQIAIALIFFFILLVIADVIFLKIQSGRPTCYDGIKNQGETRADCGGPCRACPEELLELKVISAEAIKTKENYVDLVAKIRNPYRKWGAKEFFYVFDLYDAEDNLIVSRNGISYALPQENRYIIEQKVSADLYVSRVEFNVLNVKWKELIDYEEPDLLIRNPKFEQFEDTSKLTGILENRSNYDFEEVEVWVILYDNSSNMLGVGRTEVKTVLSRDVLYFEINWLFSIKGQVENIDAIAKTNLFLDENFLRRHGGEIEKFQEY